MCKRSSVCAHGVFVLCSVHDGFWSRAGHGGSGDPEAAAVGGLRGLHRGRSAHIDPHVVSWRFPLMAERLPVKSRLISLCSLPGLSVTGIC